MDTKQMIEVMQAHMEGKAIESRAKNTETWIPATSPSWDWFNQEYRIKKEPQVMYVAPCPIRCSRDGWQVAHPNEQRMKDGGYKNVRKFVEVIEQDKPEIQAEY